MEKLRAFIEETIAPRVQGDGGWIDFKEADGNRVKVRLQGECSKCAIADRCMKWIGDEVKRNLDLDIEIEYERKKPFFWDTV